MSFEGYLTTIPLKCVADPSTQDVSSLPKSRNAYVTQKVRLKYISEFTPMLPFVVSSFSIVTAVPRVLYNRKKWFNKYLL